MRTKTPLPKPPRVEWEVPAFLPYVQPPLTDASIRAAEKQLGLRLPAAYIAALREQNGGYLRFGWKKYASSELWGIGSRYPSILKGSLAKHFEDVSDVWLPRDADKLVPFMGDGHWHMCFDARKSRAHPAIAYVDIESERHRVVAPSFEQFLHDALATTGDGEPRVGLVTSASLKTAARRIGDALDMTITNQGTWAHGYETFHGASKRPGSTAQFWVSANEVARGFARDDDHDDEHPLVALPGTALRFPEHADCSLIVEMTDLPIEKLITACERAGLSPRQLTHESS